MAKMIRTFVAAFTLCACMVAATAANANEALPGVNLPGVKLTPVSGEQLGAMHGKMAFTQVLVQVDDQLFGAIEFGYPGALHFAETVGGTSFDSSASIGPGSKTHVVNKDPVQFDEEFEGRIAVSASSQTP